MRAEKKIESAAIPSWKRLTPLILFLLTLLLFSPVRHNEFTNYDDPIYITESPLVLNGLSWDGIQAAFTGHHAYMWHPLTTISHQLDITLFGLNAGAHQMMNVVYHGLCTALLFVLLRSMTGSYWRSLIVTALFAWHPLRVESIAWVAERKDTMYGLFWVLTLLAYHRYATKTDGKNYALLFFTFALGILTKPTIVTLPCVLLLLDIWPLKRLPVEVFDGKEQWKKHWPILRKLLVEKLPLFALSGLLAVLTWKMQSLGGIIRTTGQIGMIERLGNAVVSYVRYLGKLVWPQDLVVFYPHPGQWPWGLVIIALIMVIGLSFFVFRRRKTQPWELVGWCWFLGVLFPVIGVVQSGGQSMADRYTYVACIGVLIAVIWTGEQISRQKGWRGTGLTLTVLLPLLCYITLTHTQLSYWRNSETLFRHTLAASPGNVIGYDNLGSTLIAQGRMEEAVAVITEGLQAHPGRAVLHNNLGLAYRSLGQPKAAIEQYRLALKSSPGFATAHSNLGNILRETGDLNGAIYELQEALKSDPNDTEAMNNLALTFEEAGRKYDALRLYQSAIIANPLNVEAHVNMGTLLLDLGRKEEALAICQRAVALRPNFVEANMALLYSLTATGKMTEAKALAGRVHQLAQMQNRPDIRHLLEAEVKRAGLDK
ncbi:MAG TPA: tetratricopeptide repeat protein [Verrucomicrobiae bacterium]